MVDYLYGPVPHEAFFKKYASKKFLKGKLSLIACPSLHLLKNCSFHPHAPVGQEERSAIPGKFPLFKPARLSRPTEQVVTNNEQIIPSHRFPKPDYPNISYRPASVPTKTVFARTFVHDSHP